LNGKPLESRIFRGVPPHKAGQKIGLYGGSFNPAHPGHRQASILALRRLGLDQIWWLVTPANPLKDADNLPPQAERMQQAAEVAEHPRIVISGAEAVLRTRYTADLIRNLRRRAANVSFVWIMGADNLAQLHRWEDWREIAKRVPMAVVNRPGHLLAPLSARAAQAIRGYRVDEGDAQVLAHRAPPAWTFLTGPRTPVSSTALRERTVS
jgi:nicotinate-nucleotide adenylyltransferase